ncbi:MAG TPA: ferritin-like domain-containing protein [Sphingomonas sp.]
MSAAGRGALAGARDIAEACRVVLRTADPREKAMTARAAARMWRAGVLAHRFDVAMPATPTRPARPILLPPGRMPGRGRAGSPRSRIALLHAFAHIEQVAIDLAFDCAGRFGAGLPRAFIDDWLAVGRDEAMHFALLDRRLRALGSAYGELPAHDGLWEAAGKTAGDLLARLAVVPMALEARGLDVTPATVARFEAAGDGRSAAILSRIYRDEIRHVATGTKWFATLCEGEGRAPADTWRMLLTTHANGLVRPPFNDSARRAAGLTLDYYGSLAAPQQGRQG